MTAYNLQRWKTIGGMTVNFEDLKNPELQEKLKACETAEEQVALAEEQGIELTDEELDAFEPTGIDNTR